MSVKDTRPRKEPTSELFISRWSTRKYLNEPIPSNDLEALFEAARWAPSCFNEQPWLFIYGTSEEDRKSFLPILVEANQEWAKNAPLIGVIFAKKHFDKNGKENRFAQFDTGAAWVSLALQAERLGYSAHGMGGFSQEKAHEIMKVPEDKYTAVAAFTVGKVSPSSDEEKTSRKSTQTFAIKGTFKS